MAFFPFFQMIDNVSLKKCQSEKFMYCGRNLKYSGEELAVAISQILGAPSDSKYIAVMLPV